MLQPARFLAKPYLEARAAQTLRRYFLARPPARLPVPIEDLAETLFDLYIAWEPVEDLDDQLTLGGVRPELKELILNDRACGFFEEFPGSENYTKAHEVAHWILHVREPPASVALFDELRAPPAIVCTSREPKPQREVQADICAAFLLMPADLFLDECDQRDMSRWPTIYDFRNFLGVSISALCNRLQNLGVIRINDRKIEVLRAR